MLDDGKVSNRAVTKTIVAAVEAFGINIQSTNVSVATVCRVRDHRREVKANKIKNHFSKNLIKNNKGIVHWYDKKIKDPTTGHGLTE